MGSPIVERSAVADRQARVDQTRKRRPLAPCGTWWLRDQRIDYVLARAGSPARPVVVERAFVAGDPLDGLQPSDHDAMVADFRV